MNLDLNTKTIIIACTTLNQANGQTADRLKIQCEINGIIQGFQWPSYNDNLA